MIDITDFIPKGYDNRISRFDLRQLLNLDDRSIRESIADAQARGIMIASCNGGYFRRKNKKDDPYIAEYVAQERHRFTAQSKKLKALRKAWGGDQIPGQMRLEF